MKDQEKQQQGLLTGRWIQILCLNGKYCCTHTLTMRHKGNLLEGEVLKTQMGTIIQNYQKKDKWVFSGHIIQDDLMLLGHVKGTRQTTFKLKVKDYCLEGTWFDQNNNKGTVQYYKIEKLN